MFLQGRYLGSQRHKGTSTATAQEQEGAMTDSERIAKLEEQLADLLRWEAAQSEYWHWSHAEFTARLAALEACPPATIRFGDSSGRRQEAESTHLSVL